MENVKRVALMFAGVLCLAIGMIFIILPGPAVIFLPLGLALLSFEFDWAKRWLKHCQRWMRKSAVQMDRLVARMK
ncbi:PGPGW domain-containing protein [Thalassotalea piscium]